MSTRSLSVIASEIKKDWKQVYYGAAPYLEAMSELNSIDDKYYADDAWTVVLYFLSNSNAWRGETARRVKKELRDLVK